MKRIKLIKKKSLQNKKNLLPKISSRKNGHEVNEPQKGGIRQKKEQIKDKKKFAIIK